MWNRKYVTLQRKRRQRADDDIIDFKNEKAFQRWVIESAKENDWSVYFTHDSRGSPPGFPDLVLVKEECLIFVELKTETGVVSCDQKTWIERLRNAKTIRTFLWRPSNQKDILNVLQCPRTDRLKMVLSVFFKK